MQVCLDLGNVLFHIDFKCFKENLSRLCTSPDNFIHDMEGLVDCGFVNLNAALRLYGIIMKHDNSEEIHNAWIKVVKPDDEMMAWVRRLQSRGVKVALLSNIGLDHAKHIRNIMRPIIDDCITWFSCEVGARKPSKLYFHSFLDRHPSFRGAVYLDDREDNCKTGKEYGLNSVNFKLDDFKNKNPNKRMDELDSLFDLITS